MSQQVQQQVPPQPQEEANPPVCETHSVNLSVLIGRYVANLPNKNWKVLAIDTIADKVVLVREISTKQDQPKTISSP